MVKKTKKVYVEPQVYTFAVQEESAILAASPDVSFQPQVIDAKEDNDDTNLVGE